MNCNSYKLEALQHKPMIILKIGGSVITNKNDRTIKEKKESISNIVDEIKDFNGKLILIHGAGSFGHIIANKYNYDYNQFNSYNEIHTSVVKLNQIFIKCFQKNKIKAIGISPFLISRSLSGRIKTMYIETILEMLNRNIIPVLHGDVCFDNQNRISIISGDQIVSYLTLKLNIQRVGFASDTNGILTENYNTIPIITQKNLFNYIENIRESNGIDVTGGMKGKVMEIMELIKKSNA